MWDNGEMKPLLYILVNNEPVAVSDHERWQDWINTHEREIARTDISDTIRVETWFPGVDYRIENTGPPLLFLTEVYRDGKEVERFRTATMKRAKMAHINVVARLMKEENDRRE